MLITSEFFQRIATHLNEATETYQRTDPKRLYLLDVRNATGQAIAEVAGEGGEVVIRRCAETRQIRVSDGPH